MPRTFGRLFAILRVSIAAFSSNLSIFLSLSPSSHFDSEFYLACFVGRPSAFLVVGLRRYFSTITVEAAC